jgi:fatty acid desaturase
MDLHHQGRPSGGHGTVVEQPGAVYRSPAVRSRRVLLETHLERIERSRREVTRTVHRAPRLLLIALLAIPAALAWGPGAAVLVVVMAVTLAMVTVIVAGSHRAEYAIEERTIRDQLARLDLCDQLPA